MKHTLLIITALMLVVGFSSGQEPIDESTLDWKDGLNYAPGSEVPYSGVAVRYYYGNGQMSKEGTYKDRKRDGKETGWYENGQKDYEITYKDGKQDGKGTGWYENGQKYYEITFKDGKRDGKGTGWYENGQKNSEGTYKDGGLDGKWTWWFSNGQKESEGTYKDGKRNGLRTWWDDKGQKEFEDNYKEGKRGLSTFWYINGRKKWEGIFIDVEEEGDGGMDGLWTFWNDDGDIKRKLNFRDGIPDGEYDSWSPGASNPYILTEGVFNAFRDDDVIEFIQLLGVEPYGSMESSFMSFSRLRREMLNIGVNWSEAEFTETRIGATKDFTIIFKSGDKSYGIRLDNCVYSNGKWFSGNPDAGGLLDDD